MPNFIRRILAYGLDFLAVTFISGVLSMSILNPNYDKTTQITEQYQTQLTEIQEKMSNMNDEEASDLFKEFIQTYKEAIRELNKLSLYDDIILTVILILYFGVFAYFFDGETVGKRIMRFKIVSNDGEKASIWKLVLRTLILYGITITFMNILLSYILDVEVYFKFYIVFYGLSIILELSILLMIVLRKDNRGVHDLVAGTKVIEVERR